jgi:hypothetical protein
MLDAPAPTSVTVSAECLDCSLPGHDGTTAD